MIHVFAGSTILQDSSRIVTQGHAYVRCPQVKASGADDSCIFQRKRITVFRAFVVYCT